MTALLERSRFFF